MPEHVERADEAALVLDEALKERARGAISAAREALLTENASDPLAANATALVGELEADLAFAQSSDYELALIGAPGVGKTTALCAIAGLRRNQSADLTRDVALLTGAGRTTLSEVVVRRGGDFRIEIEPISPHELEVAVREFAADLTRELEIERNPLLGPDDEEGVQSAELRRALRGLAGLQVVPIRNERGHFIGQRDAARELAAELRDVDALAAELLRRIDPAKRTQTSFVHSGRADEAMDWLASTTERLNNGLEPSAPLPARLTVFVPRPVVDGAPPELDSLALIDSRGIDDPAAVRKDIQGFLDGERSVLVLCSGFEDAPDAVAQSVIRQARRTGRGDALLQRTALLVLVRGGADALVVAPWGGCVQSADEGRFVRQQQVEHALRPYGLQDLRVLFLDVSKPDDVGEVRDALLRTTRSIRDAAVARIASRADYLERFVRERHDKMFRDRLTEALRPVRRVLRNTQSLPATGEQLGDELVRAIESVRYASTLRASVNRDGEWHNFDYWVTLASIVRASVSKRAARAVLDLSKYLDDALSDDHFAPVHDVLRSVRERALAKLHNFLVTVEHDADQLLRSAPALETDYWSRSQKRWGDGPGYKAEVAAWAGEHLSRADMEDLHARLEERVQSGWTELVTSIESSIGTLDDEPSSM